jgi:hypothetical protein
VVQVGVVDVRGRGTWRADLGASSRLATYRGRIQADDGAQALPLARYEQVELRGGALDGSAAPLRYHGDDPWDREELGDALAADRLAEQLSSSFAADHGEELRPASFYADFVDAEAPVLDRLEDLAPRRRGALVGPPAPVLVAVVVTDALVVEGGFLPGPAVSRVAELRRGGASWGLLLVRHDLGPAALRAAADRALDQAADAGARRGAEIGGSGSAGSDAAGVDAADRDAAGRDGSTAEPATGGRDADLTGDAGAEGTAASAPGDDPGPSPSPSPTPSPSPAPPPSPTPEGGVLAPLEELLRDPGGGADDLLDGTTSSATDLLLP